MNIFSNKTIATEFRNVLPDHPIDTLLFDTTSYQDLQNVGLIISPLKVIHSASVHYQPRYRRYPSLRFVNSFVELIPSFTNLPDNNNFYLNDHESSEFQTRSSEVVGVGLCVALISKLFKINRNRISIIEDSGKRCDLEFEKGGRKYIVESKGRKCKYSIKLAIEFIFTQKSAYGHGCKYGVISYLPRSSTPVSLIVVDPEYDDVPISRDNQIIRLLKYYSRQSLLAGFWRLSSLLNERIAQLETLSDISNFDKVELDFQNIIKMGQNYTIKYSDDSLETFFDIKKDSTFRYQNKNQTFFFALDKKIIDILEKQDFSALLNYSFNEEQEMTIEVDGDFFSINNDGSVLAVVNNDKLNI